MKLTLKTYQNNALTALEQFLQACMPCDGSPLPVAEAFKAVLATQGRCNEPYQAIFGEIPAVCLRVPTGGGKTILAAHAVAKAGRLIRNSEAPVALWLTPSDTIRAQTLEALSDIRHPYREALAGYFGDRVQVCDLESLQTVSPHDIGKCCIIVVATIQSFNVTDTAKRNVYSFFEELAPHFDTLPPNLANGLEKVTENDLQAQPYLTTADIGRVKHSVANWMNLRRPVVIVDEAHNNRTDRFFRTLGRLNPCCIIELTATPVPGNNVLYHVSAQELKAEQMIKLPIVLAEHPEGWQGCLHDAMLTRHQLEQTALHEQDYIRPILLIQAGPKGSEATVEVVRQHLLEQENVEAEQIAVATGSQKELAGVNLFDRSCKVRYVITVEALKEGWDCSFAYVLSSMQSVNSAKDVEQLLGRVLRMPYAKERQQPALNKAYAHIVASNFAEAAKSLKDRMVQNMGFERLETDSLILPQQDLPLSGGEDNRSVSGRIQPKIPDCHIEIPAVPDTTHWPDEIREAVRIHETSQGATVLIPGSSSPEVLGQARAFISNAVPDKARAAIEAQFQAHHAMRRALLAPAQLGVSFARIPQLCLRLDGYLEVVEKETLSALGDWNLLDYPVQLDGFALQEQVSSFEIDVKEAQVKYRFVDVQQLHLNDMKSHVSQNDLIRWLDKQVRKPYLIQRQLQHYLLKLIGHLLHDRHFSLTALVRARYQLAQEIDREIERLRQCAMAKGFQGRLFEMAVPPLEEMAHFSFQFQPGQYPARQIYRGSWEFQKHFYPVIHDLQEKTAAGKETEEFQCARIIDVHPDIRHWVRNIPQQEKFSFWLPTSTDYFYPDFVAELTDDRVLVIEYKGAHLSTNDESKEKSLIGEQWEKSSNGQCLFLFARSEKEDGRSLKKQLEDKLRRVGV